MFQRSETGMGRVVLAIGGMDPSGGAGILLDAGAIRAAGAHPAGIVTGTTLQDGSSFKEAFPADSEYIIRAVQMMLGDPGLAAIKIGALFHGKIVDRLASVFKTHFLPPVVLDPVIASSTGGRLLDDEGIEILKSRLMNQVTLITPNIPEAEILTGNKIDSRDDAARAAKKLLDMGAKAVLIKGGHLKENKCVDFLLEPGGRAVFESPRLSVGKVRGTGCALSSLIAAFLAKGEVLEDAVSSAREILLEALAGSVQMGIGSPVLGMPIGPCSGDQNLKKF